MDDLDLTAAQALIDAAVRRGTRVTIASTTMQAMVDELRRRRAADAQPDPAAGEPPAGLVPS